MKKRLLALLLVLVMVAGALPTLVMAEEAACTHENAAWRESNGIHELFCSNCWSFSTSHTPNYQDDVCTVCSLERCTHENTVWNNSAFGHSLYCYDCDTEIVEHAEHSQEENGCPNCGSNYCAHDAFTWKEAYNRWDGGAMHYQRCNYCGFDITYPELHADEDADGACDDCGVKCFHENVEHTEYGDHCEVWCKDCSGYVGGSQHWWATCETCYLKAPCGPTCTYEEGSNVCTMCGRTNEYEYTWNYDEKNHWKVCGDCGLALNGTFGSGGTSLKPHEDADGVGGCDTCGYGCTHETELKNVKAATCTAKGYTGDEVCKHCGVTVKTGSETAMISHDYKDGICTVCQAKDPLTVKVEPAAGTPDVSAEIPTQELLTEADKAAIQEGTPVEILLTVENADKTVAAAEKAEIEKAVEKLNAANEPAEGETKVGMYLDINLTKTVGDTETPITETAAKVEISVDVPAALQNAAEGVNRVFSVLRFHNGQVDELKDMDNDPDTVTFQTDRFSTYVLVYTDKSVEEPQEPTEKPEEPTEKPEEPTEKPEEPTEKPEEPTEKPEEPTEKPEEPTEKPEEPTEKPEEPTEKPEEPTEKPEEPTEKPEEPTEKPTEPSKPEGETPATGDEANLLVCAFLLLVSLLGVTVLVVDKKKCVR